MMKIFIPFKFSGTNPEECNAISMSWVEVGMNFKNKPTHFIIFHIHRTVGRFTAGRLGCYFDKRIQHFPHAKIIDGTTKKYRGYFCSEVFLYIQLAIHTINQIHIFPQCSRIGFSQFLIHNRI